MSLLLLLTFVTSYNIDKHNETLVIIKILPLTNYVNIRIITIKIGSITA